MTTPVKDGGGVSTLVSTTINPGDGGIVGSTCITDPSSGKKASVNASGQLEAAITFNGSVGTDYSVNKPTIPNVGDNFAASGPYASYVLLQTVEASAVRKNIEVLNTSGAQIVVIRDDGVVSAGAQPTNASLIALAGGAGVGSQGGSWYSRSFRGRLQVYAPSAGAFVTIMQD